MKSILELMFQFTFLSYAVNNYPDIYTSKIKASDVDKAENSVSTENAEFDDETSEYLQLRKKTFELSRAIFDAIGNLSVEEKEALAERIKAIKEEYVNSYTHRIYEYQSLIAVVSQDSFSFKKNPEYKNKLEDAKENCNRFKAAVEYYENMYAYVNAFAKSSKRNK